MAYEGLLSQIANPQIADVAGALDYRAAKLQQEQERQKELKMNELISQAIPHLREGSILSEIAKNDPKSYFAYSKLLGIPTNEGERMESFTKDVRTLNSIGQKDREGALNYAQNLLDERSRLGMDTGKLGEWIQEARTNPDRGFNALNMMDETLNKDLIAAEQQKAAEFRLKERQVEQKDKELQIKDRELSQGGGSRQFAGQVVNTSEGLAVFDPSTNTFKRASLDGKPLTGASYDADLKRQLSEAGAEGAATGKDIVDYKGKLFDSINSGARTLNKYNFAIDQIDKGAESGPIMKMLPNLREQTILVDVIRKEIGMEILGSGALGVNPTDKDVTLAMDSAIPEGLKPQALKTELQRRAKVLQDLNTAQEKYYDLIEQGYTKGDILKMAKANREPSQQTTTKPQGKLVYNPSTGKVEAQ